MTQNELYQLGFEKIEYNQEQLDNEGFFEDTPYFFFAHTLDEVVIENRYQEQVDKEALELVTCPSDAFDLPDVDGAGWYVEFSDYTNIRFYKQSEVKILLDLFSRNKKLSDQG